MLTLASLMTLAQRAISALIKAANCSSVPDSVSTPAFCIFSRVSGSAAILSHSAFSRLMMSRGVPAGARMPYQVVTSEFSTPASLIVGTLSSDGRTRNRLGISATSEIGAKSLTGL